MAKLEIIGNQIIITKSKESEFWSLSSQMTIPLKTVKSASISKKLTQDIRQNKWGLYGDNFSFDYNGGALLQNEDKIYWDVRDIHNLIELHFINEESPMLIIDVEHPQETMRNIRKAIIELANKKQGLAEVRKSKKITQEELANAVGVTRQTIISLENKKYTASLPLAFKISKFFDMTIEELFGGE